MNYYNEIKECIINNEPIKKVKEYSKNRSDLNTYYNVGKLLAEAGKHYGKGIIKEYSKMLTEDLNFKYTKSSLYNMLKFYYFVDNTNFQTASGNLSWSHYCELLSIKDFNKINYYINISKQQNLSVRELRTKIKNNEYERLDDETKNKLINKQEVNAFDLIKDPIVIENSGNYEIISEKILQKLILEDLPSFLKELGEGFTFVDNEYKIKLGDKYNYIDLLLYNIKYRCYVVVELKITFLKKEHIGQIKMYMNYIDRNVKSIFDDFTIGIIIVKKKDKYVMEYCSCSKIISKEYEVV